MFFFSYLLLWLVPLHVFQSPELEFFKQSMGARNRVGIGLSYRPARLHKRAELFPWNQFLGSIKYGFFSSSRERMQGWSTGSLLSFQGFFLLAGQRLFWAEHSLHGYTALGIG